MREWTVRAMRRETRIEITDFRQEVAEPRVLGSESSAAPYSLIFEWICHHLAPGDSISWNGRTIGWAQVSNNNAVN